MLKFNEYYIFKEEIEAQQEILLFESEFVRFLEVKNTHPGKDIPEKKKSDIVKKARRGEKVFGGGFDEIEKEAGKRYGSKEAGKRVAAAIMWKKAKGKHMTSEDVDNLIWILEDDINIILDTYKEEGLLVTEKKWIQNAVNPSHKGYCTPITKKTCTPHRKALAMRFKKGID